MELSRDPGILNDRYHDDQKGVENDVSSTATQTEQSPRSIHGWKVLDYVPFICPQVLKQTSLDFFANTS